MKAHDLSTFRSLVAVAALCGLAAGPLVAQEPGRAAVVVRGGMASFDKASSLENSGFVGLDAMYGISSWLSMGPALSIGRPSTNGDHFVSVISYGVLTAGGDTTSFYRATQPVNLLDGAFNVKVRLPGRALSPYATGGVGGYALFLDPQVNRGERHKVGLAFNVGAGVAYAFNDRAGLIFDVRSQTYTDYDREILDPRFPGGQGQPNTRVENTLFAEDFPAAPKAKSTVTNFAFSFGFTYVPSFLGGGR
jgi:hypothetical protein